MAGIDRHVMHTSLSSAFPAGSTLPVELDYLVNAERATLLNMFFTLEQFIVVGVPEDCFGAQVELATR